MYNAVPNIKLSKILIILLVIPICLHCTGTKRSFIRELVEKNIEKVGHLLFKGVPKSYLNYKQGQKKEEPDFATEKAKHAAQAKKMFFHAYNSYMMYAFPADELMPLSCKGRVVGLTPSRGEIDDALGRYMLTLVDTLDTLVVLKEYQSFEYAVKMVIRGLSFDTDVTVSLFEANIRVLGGLLGGHAGCVYLQSIGRAVWYSNELLHLAVDLGNRFLPAFNTPTGLPIPKINLRHGVYGIQDNETCTACAGSLYLEFAALSRYTGNATYESVARVALEYLYENRVPGTDLPGSVMNIHKGTWTRKESTVGAGIDSYYEYLIKGYMVSGDKKLWDMFHTQYSAVRKHLMKGKYMLTVHSTNTYNRVRDYQDALQAFWPGVQVLAGDIKEAERVFEHYAKVASLNQYTLPEAFLLDERMFWPQYYMRPELVESAYILYKATKDPKYLDIGVKIMNAIENRCKVVCGYAGLKNAATGELEDRLDSFVLAETFKYLYLLFAEEGDIGVPLDKYVLTTEAHIVPLSIQLDTVEQTNSTTETCNNEEVYTWSHVQHGFTLTYTAVTKDQMVCTPDDQPFLDRKSRTTFRQDGPRTITAHLRVESFDYNNNEHVSTLRSMGITIEQRGETEGQKIQLVHNSAKAFSEQLGLEGILFMREIMKHAKDTEAGANLGYKELFVQSILLRKEELFSAGKAMFGPELTTKYKVSGKLVMGIPDTGCSEIVNILRDRVVVFQRGSCMFIDKVRNAQKAGALAVVILDNVQTAAGALAMSGDGSNDVKIPAVFLNKADGDKLMDMYRRDPEMMIVEMRGPTQPSPDPKCGS